jgi:hypothetical protein
MFRYAVRSQYSLDALSERDLQKFSLSGAILIAGLGGIIGIIYSRLLNNFQPIFIVLLEIGFCGIIIGLLSWVLVYEPKSSKKLSVSVN